MLTVETIPPETLEFLKPAHNVRISISGLAFCKLKVNESEIKFLRHIQFHELVMEVIQREAKSNSKVVSSTFTIGANHDIVVKPRYSDRPDNIALYVGDEYNLSHIVNFANRDLHNAALRPKERYFSADDRITTLKITNCAFFTGKRTEEEYDLIEETAPEPANFDAVEEPTGVEVRAGRVGLEMKGVITCPPENKTSIEVTGPRPFNLDLLQRIGDVDFMYEINFNNHCTQPPDLCRNVAGSDSDFRFYYDVLEQEDNPRRRFRLRLRDKKGETIGLKPAVCNVTRNGV
jgi:hypothetical protein